MTTVFNDSGSKAFNASTYLLDRHVERGDGDRLALTGVGGETTYAQLHERVVRAAASLQTVGLEPEQRLMMFMADSPEFVVLFLAALRIGAVPVPVSTMLHTDGLAELLRDARARLLAVGAEFRATAEKAAAQAPELVAVITAERGGFTASVPVYTFAALEQSDPLRAPYLTGPDSPAFWLYTSGTTGNPKAAMHRHGSIRVVCETYGDKVLRIRRDDRCLSAAKAFFAYGLGNSLLFPLAAGAAAILEPARARPAVMAAREREYGATLFFAGPTFFANMLHADLPDDSLAGVRLAVSAGETLPEALYRRWTGRFGIDILDGIGMTEMLHIFLSNREGEVHPGTTGVAVPGYQLRILDDNGAEVPTGEPGSLYVRGDSAATGYWSRYDASRRVFQGEWLCTGDTYVQDAEGYYTCLGRTTDMIKASGMWVTPSEVEARILEHPAVDQAAVVACLDADGLEKPVAYAVLAAEAAESDPIALETQIIEFCREGLPSYKRPRRVVFLDALPTTATGKVRRVELRAAAVGLLSAYEGR